MSMSRATGPAIYMKCTVVFGSSAAASAFVQAFSGDAKWIAQHVSYFLYVLPDGVTCCWTIVHASSALLVESWRYLLNNADLMVRFRCAARAEWHVVGALSADAAAELEKFTAAFPQVNVKRCAVRGGYVAK